MTCGRWLFPLLVALLLASPSGASDVYVDPVLGDDANPGTPSAPFKTVRVALGRGTDVHLAPGTYDESSGEVYPWGAGIANTIQGAGAGTTLVSCAGEGPVFSVSSAGTFGRFITVSDVEIRGPGTTTSTLLEVLNGPSTGAELVGVRASGFGRIQIVSFGERFNSGASQLSVVRSELHDCVISLHNGNLISYPQFEARDSLLAGLSFAFSADPMSQQSSASVSIDQCTLLDWPTLFVPPATPPYRSIRLRRCISQGAASIYRAWPGNRDADFSLTGSVVSPRLSLLLDDRTGPPVILTTETELNAYPGCGGNRVAD